MKVIGNGSYVIESDIEISTLIESAAIVNEPFAGRYLLKQFGPHINFNIEISEDQITERYRKLRQKEQNLSLPSAATETLYWLSEKGCEQENAIIFAAHDSDILEGFEFGIKIIKSCQHTILVRMILFNAGEKPNGISIRDHNKSVFEKFDQIGSGSEANAWLKMVCPNINHIIRQFITRERNKFVGTIK